MSRQLKAFYYACIILPFVLLNQNCSNSFDASKSLDSASQSLGSEDAVCIDGDQKKGFLNSSSLYPQICMEATQTCVNGQWDFTDNLLSSCMQYCVHPTLGTPQAQGSTYISFGMASGASQAACNASRVTSICNAKSGTFLPAPAANASCAVAGQTCAYTTGAGRANPSGNNTGATVTGYAVNMATYPNLCGSQVTRTCQSSGQWTGAVPLYTTCTQNCLDPDSSAPVAAGTNYKAYWKRNSGTKAECDAAFVAAGSSSCVASSGQFVPTLPTTRFAACTVVTPTPTPTPVPTPTPTPTATPTACAKGGATLWSNLESCGWPGPKNTGPDMTQCPGGLTAMGTSTTSKTTVSTANTVISCKNIMGGLEITAQNVTIKNSIVTYNGGGANASGVITINDGASATIDHVETNGMNRTHACIWNEGVKGTTLKYSLVATAVNCYGINDGIFSWWWSKDKNAGAGSDFIIQDSYLHDFTQNAANGHIDGYQTEGASNGIIRHNTFKMVRVPGDVDVAGGGLNAAVAIWNDFNQSTPTGLNATNFQVSNNLFGGGAFLIYAQDYSPGDGAPGNPSPAGGNTLTDVHFTNNVFSSYLGGACVGSYGIWFYRASWSPYAGGPTDLWNKGGSSRAGNVVLETGFNLDNGNPSGCN